MHYMETKIQFYCDYQIVSMALDMQSMAQALGSLEKRQWYYEGNLKRHKKLKTLSQHHFIVPDCDDFGDLLQSYVFVQFVGIMLGNEFDHILICHKCNEEAESLQQILMKGKRWWKGETKISENVQGGLQLWKVDKSSP